MLNNNKHLLKVLDYRKRLTDYVEQMRENSGNYKLDEFSKDRKLDMESIKDAGIFYIGEPVEMMVPDYIDSLRDFGVIAVNNMPIYNNRYVIPIKDCMGYVMALVGYKAGLTEKYMYANTKYFNRGDALYGLEDMDTIINSKCCFVIEGLMDRIRMKSLGFRNSLATCGADKSWERYLMFNGLKRCIFIPDMDRAGANTKYYWRSDAMVRILLPKGFKDIDEFARNEEVRDFSIELLSGVQNWMVHEASEGVSEVIDIAKLLNV